MLFPPVAADLILELQYKQKECKGPPDTFYAFEVANPWGYAPYDPSLNETWSPYFKFQATELSVGDCGNVYVPIPGYCCIGTMDISLSFPYYSGIALEYNQPLTDLLPVGARGSSYCALGVQNINDTFALNGYKGIWALPNGGNCIDNYYQCKVNGSTAVFSVYSQPNCNGVEESIQLTFQIQNYTSDLLGNVTVQYLTVTDAAMFYSWVAYMPMEILVPHFDYYFDFIALVLFVISMLMLLYTLYSTGMEMLTKKVCKFSQIITLVGQFLWLLYISGVMVAWCVPFPQLVQMAAFEEYVGITHSLSMLASCVLTTMLLNTILFPDYWYARYISWSTLVIVHVGLFGSNYDMWYLNGGQGEANTNMDFFRFLLKWNGYGIYWTYFVFVYNTIIPLLISYKIMLLAGKFEKGHYSSFFKRIQKIDPYFILIIFGQLLVVTANAVLNSIKLYTSMLGNDLVYNDTLGCSALILTLHSFFTWKTYTIIRKSSDSVRNNGQKTKITQSTAYTESVDK
ncbi:hypothetical protein HK103_000708 [Boothiomyces macroporosus]|uniref:Uncharacterized protein n=1 Tax=Boothiomyces macroporosus TaxID=261099 RepID=A0AAD5Y5S7_9FUNG|nr:hypothetical protein HK103_000708 [Boothiomyces macroporosus]